VERTFDDSSATYTLGYYPSNKKWDGQYRHIKVRIRRNGAEIRNRQGYYSVDFTQAKGHNPNQEVASALSDATPSTLVSFTARIKPPSENSAKGKIGVTFLVDAATLSFEDSPNGKRFNVGFFAALYSRDGRMLSNLSQRVDQVFSTEEYQQILRRGMMLHMDLDPQPLGDQIRLAVEDVRTGFVGTINAPSASN
jgi:hypothetical protein